MKRCPACGTVYSVAQGFCPMDGAALAEDAAPSPAAGPVGAVGAAWDPPRAPAADTAAPTSVVGPGRAGPATRVAAFSPVLGPGTTAGGFAVPPQARPVSEPAARFDPLPPTSDPAETGTAFIPPLAAPGAVRPSPTPAAPAPARTVMAFVPPAGRDPFRPKSDPGPGVDIPRLTAGAPTSAPNSALVTGPAPGTGPAPSTGANNLAAVPSVAAVPSGGNNVGNNGVQVEGAFFPAGGLARPRNDGPAPNSWEESLIGRVLDQRYRIESCIGAGGMGVVYKATHVIIDKPLAIKMLRAEVANQPDVIKRFLLEAQLASRVKHPNVVDISDYGQIAGQTAYYVMEYLVGETLAHRIDNSGRVDPSLAVEIAVQMAQALQAAHAGKIIHRDLKSENIFLCERPDGTVQAKILDFGIARIRDKKTRLTAMGALIGTPAYMSPEQAQGADVDERSDLYALGVIMFEMFAGRVPFKAPTVAMILSAQIFDAPPRLHEVDASVPDLPNIEHVIQTLLAKNRDERPRDATEVIHLIKTAAELDLAPPVTSGPASSGAGKRRPTVTIGSWSVAENPSGLQRVDNTAPAVAGEARSTPRPDADVVVARKVSASGRIQRRPSVIVPSGTHVERIAAPPTRPPITGEQEARHYPTGVNQAVRSAGPPMILIIAAAASIGAAITVTLYKVWRRNQAPIAIQQPVEQPAPVAMTRLGFESDPPGATVYTESGERWGVTPFTRELPATSPRTRVIFKLAGYDDLPLDVNASQNIHHKVPLRPRIAEPAPVMAPAPDGATAANGLGTASATDPVPGETAANPVSAAVAAKSGASTKPAKTKPDAASKASVPATTTPLPATPTDDGDAELDDLNMGELKNPFRKK